MTNFLAVAMLHSTAHQPTPSRAKNRNNSPAYTLLPRHPYLTAIDTSQQHHSDAHLLDQGSPPSIKQTTIHLIHDLPSTSPCDRNASCSLTPIDATMPKIMLYHPSPWIVQLHAASRHPCHALHRPHEPASAPQLSQCLSTGIVTASTSHHHGSSGKISESWPPKSPTFRLRPSPRNIISPTPNMPSTPLLAHTAIA